MASYPTYTEIQRLWRAHDKALNATRHVTVALGGSGNMEFCKLGLQMALAERGINSSIELTSYDNWIGAALSGDVIANAWIIWMSSMATSCAEIERPALDLRSVITATATLLRQGAIVIVAMPEALPSEDDPTSVFGQWRREFSRCLEQGLPTDVICLRLDHVQRKLGDRQWFAPRYWTMAKAPCHPDGATAVGIEAGMILAQVILPSVKAIVVDLDNTIWGGVVGDDGPEGLKLDRFSDGRPFLALQRFLLDLKHRGIPLAVVSKNEPENARAPFLMRPEMLLKLEDFVHFHSSWNKKYLAIADIAHELNLGIDAICFLDDSPQERAEAKYFLPDLIVPELPEDPEQWLLLLRESGLFSTPRLLADDAERSIRYVDEKLRRKALEEAPDIDQYLRDLKMVLIPQVVDQANLPRVGALVQKTNQFNLTNRRHSALIIRKLSEQTNSYAYCFTLEDRFGSMGIISAVIATTDDGILNIDTWVLSCRVFGREVEHAILDHILRWCQSRSILVIRAPFNATVKNQPVANFLASSGFAIEHESPNERFFIARCSEFKLKHQLATTCFD